MTIEVTIDYEKCVRCRNCVNTCSFGVLEWLDDMPIIAHPSQCGGCRECLKNCPTNAIIIKEK